MKISEVKQVFQLQEWSGLLRLPTKTGTLEIWDADRSVLDQVLQAMLHAE